MDIDWTLVLYVMLCWCFNDSHKFCGRMKLTPWWQWWYFLSHNNCSFEFIYYGSQNGVLSAFEVATVRVR